MIQPRSKLWDTASTLIVTAAAVVMTWTYLADRNRAQEPGPRIAREWEEWQAVSIPLGAEDGDITITGFMDFTCPFCARLAPVLDSVMEEYPERVRVDFIHFPIPGHVQAIPAAIAAECAHRQDRFKEVHDLLMLATRSSVAADPTSFPSEVSFRDSFAFLACLQEPVESFPRIQSGLVAGERAGVLGTPTVWLNGVEFNGRSLTAFRRGIQRLVDQ